MSPEVYYQNHKGDKFILNGDGLTFMDLTPVRSFEWNYNLSNRVNGMGSLANGFARWARNVEIEIRQRGFTKQQFYDQMNRLHEVTEIDCLNEKPGRLYACGQYLTCFLSVSGAIDNNAPFTNFAYRKANMLIVEPYWCTETTTIFHVASSATQDTTGKRYTLKYPYRYGTSYSSNKLINTFYADCPAIITIYGAVDNPSVVINSNTFNVDVTLTATQRLVIDQVEKKIYTIDGSGNKTNVFNKRNKAYDIFKPLVSGENTVVYDGSFMMTIALIARRSELRWTS